MSHESIDHLTAVPDGDPGHVRQQLTALQRENARLRDENRALHDAATANHDQFGHERGKLHRAITAAEARIQDLEIQVMSFKGRDFYRGDPQAGRHA